MDLVQIIRNTLDQQIIGKIAAALGADINAVSRALDTALPAIFGGMAAQASTPTGAASLSTAFEKVDTGIVDNLGGSLTGGNAQTLIETGNKLLPAIFGPNYSGTLSSLARQTGLGTGKIGPLLAMLCPIVMSILSRVTKESGLDFTRLIQMISDQARNFVGAEPGLTEPTKAGISSLPAKPAFSPAAKPVPSKSELARGMATSTAGTSTAGRWLIPVLALAAVALAAYIYLFSRDRGEIVPTTGPSRPPAEMGAGGITAIGGPRNAEKQADSKLGVSKDSKEDAKKDAPKDSSDAPKVEEGDEEKKDDAESNENRSSAEALTEYIADARKAFADIKDEESAKSAAEVWNGLAKKVDAIDLSKMGQATKVVIAPAINKFVEDAKAWSEKAYANPEVKSILEPRVNAVLDKLSKFAN